MDVSITGLPKKINIKGFDKIGDVNVVMVKGEKGDVGNPTQTQVDSAVADWLDDHPEATTTVQDGSITLAKLATDIHDDVASIPTIMHDLYIDQEQVTIQTVDDAVSFILNSPKGLVHVTETDAPIFSGTPNIIDLFGLAQGTFTNSTLGVTVEINGYDVYIHGSPSGGFRFDLQTGEFYTDAFTNHVGNIDIFPVCNGGYRFCWIPLENLTLPSNVYFATLNKAGSGINPIPLSGQSCEFYKNNSYFAIYSNGAISNLNTKFRLGIKLLKIPATIANIASTPTISARTQIIQGVGYYDLDEFTWTGNDTNCTVYNADRRYANLEAGRKYVWFGDSISQLKDLPNRVADILATTVYDCTFAGAPLTYGDPTKYQPTGFMSLCSQIVAEDFTPLSSALDAQEQAGVDVTEKRQHLATLQSLNFNNVTDIVIFAGTNDFDNDYVNATNFVSGFTNALTTLLTAYPHLMVYVISPIWRGDKSTGKATIPTMPDLVNLEKQVADSFCLPFYDLYHRSGINSFTKSVYLLNDLVHPSEAGDSLLANKCAKFIQSN